NPELVPITVVLHRGIVFDTASVGGISCDIDIPSTIERQRTGPVVSAETSFVNRAPKKCARGAVLQRDVIVRIACGFLGVASDIDIALGIHCGGLQVIVAVD